MKRVGRSGRGAEARAARRARRARERFERAVLAWDAARGPRPLVPLGAFGERVEVPPFAPDATNAPAFVRGPDGAPAEVLGGAAALAEALEVVRASLRNGRKALARLDAESSKRALFARYESEADEFYKDGLALSVPQGRDETLEDYDLRLDTVRRLLRARLESSVTSASARVRQTSDNRPEAERAALYILTRKERKSLRRAYYDRYGAFPTEDELRRFVAERKRAF